MTAGAARRTLLFAASLSAVVGWEIAGRAYFAETPLNDNEAAAATIARCMSRGGLLYVDVTEIKPPGMFMAYQAAFAVWGTRDRAVRSLATAAVVATTLLLAALGWRMHSRGAGLLAAAFYSVSTWTPLALPWAANADLLMQPAVVASFLLLHRAWDDRRPLPWALAGAAIGAALEVKQTAALYVLAACACLVWLRRARETKTLLGGCAAAQVLAYAAAGAPPLREYLYWHWGANLEYVRYGWEFRSRGLSGSAWLWVRALFDLSFVAAGTIVMAWGGQRSGRAAPAGLWIWIAGSAVQALTGGWAYLYWAAQLIPPMCCACAVACLRGGLSRVQRGVLALAAIVSVVAAVDMVRLYTSTKGETVLDRWLGRGRDFRLGRSAGARMAQLSWPGETLYVFGQHPGLYWYSGLAPATPHLWHWLPRNLAHAREGFEPLILARRPDWVAVVREERGSDSTVLKRLLATGYRGDLTYRGSQTIDLWRRTERARNPRGR